MTPEALRTALSQVVAKGDFQVPPYPAVALKLQRIFARENYGIGEISDAIAADPALATRILGLANSALYRATDDITTLPRAVNRLGGRIVSALALAAGLGATATQAGALFDVKYRVWRRSVTTALACQKLAPLRGLDASEAFLLGLIHGFGRSVAVAAIEQLLVASRGVTPLVLLRWLEIAEAERGPLALAVAARWQLPAAIVGALRPEAVLTRMGALVTEAERIATMLETSWRPEALTPDEAQAIDDLVRGLPAALDALAAVPPPAPGRPVSAVAPVEHALHGALKPSRISIADCRKKGAATLAAIAIGHAGIELTSSAQLQEGSMVRLAVGADAERFEAWFNVLLGVPVSGGFRVEAELFSPPREIHDRWQALYASATLT